MSGGGFNEWCYRQMEWSWDFGNEEPRELEQMRPIQEWASVFVDASIWFIKCICIGWINEIKTLKIRVSLLKRKICDMTAYKRGHIIQKHYLCVCFGSYSTSMQLKPYAYLRLLNVRFYCDFRTCLMPYAINMASDNFSYSILYDNVFVRL